MDIKDNKVYLSWEDFDNMIKFYFNKEYNPALKYQEFSGVYGIPRGGLVIATAVSHKLGIPLLAAPAKNCLVVDDIDDTGKTLEHYLTLKSVTVFTWVAKYTLKRDIEHLYHTSFQEDYWVVFPWEYA